MDTKYDEYGHELLHNEDSRSREFENTDRLKSKSYHDRSQGGRSGRSPKRQRQRGRGDRRGRGRKRGRGRGRQSYRGGYGKDDNPFVRADSSAVLEEIRGVNDEHSWRRRR